MQYRKWRELAKIIELRLLDDVESIIFFKSRLSSLYSALHQYHFVHYFFTFGTQYAFFEDREQLRALGKQHTCDNRLRISNERQDV